MLVRYQNKMLRYSLESKLYETQGVLDDVEVSELTNGTSYEVDFESYKWLNDVEYLSNINNILKNFNSMFRLSEFSFDETLGGMWIFVKI